jgi:hypothetical protein
MGKLVTSLFVVLFSSAAVAQNVKRTDFEPRDFSGVWGRFGGEARTSGIQGGGGCAECGDAGFGSKVPPFTAQGRQKFDANKPAYGRPAESPVLAGEVPLRHKGVLSALSNDPTMQCEPLGAVRLVLSTYFSPMEWVVSPDRVLQHFEWTNEWREIFTDGRQIPAEPDIPRWNGFSVGRWDGDTFIVNSSGYDERTWLDHFGFPHSAEMRVEERYRKIAADKIELIMTVDDPKIYANPFLSDKKIFRKLSQEEATIDGWQQLLDDRCVPSEESDFNKTVRDPSGGIAHDENKETK